MPLPRAKKVLLWSAAVVAGLYLLFFLLDTLFPLDRERLHKPLSTLIYDAQGELLRIKRSSDGYYRFKVRSEEIPPLLKRSVLHFEDRYFYHHIGFNPVSIVKALWHNMSNDRRIGGSTITMQVARMMHHKERTLVNKLSEIFTALQLEWHYTKDEILMLYFNLAPYGGNIDGIKTAAWFYYKKPLKALSIAQIALLTTIPKNPNVNRPDRASNLYEKRLRVLRLLLEQKLIDHRQFDRAFKEPIEKKRFAIPLIAPHFTDQFKKEGVFQSSLDQGLHRQIIQILRTHVDRLYDKNLHNAAAIVIHNPTMQIRAFVGSERFFNKKNLGQNNGITMIRAPGSTLKPFIYAKALDQGLITPKRKLFDLPLHYKAYDPQNYSRTFEGEVSAQNALQDSLNIPAVELNHLLKDDSLYELLRKADISSINQDKEYYGESMALGGFGISLLDIAHLYTAFAHEGALKTVGNTQNHKMQNITQLFSKEAAYLTMQMLSDGVRPEFSAYWESAPYLTRIAFKTGTSAEAKDLYSVGVTPEYTVAVWMGNFSGAPTKDLSSRESAAYVLFDIFKTLSEKKSLSWFKRPDQIQDRPVCTDALLQGRCQTLEEDSVIKGVVLKRPCELLRAEVLAYLKAQNRLPKDSMLEHPCSEVWNRYPPMISSLYDGQTIIKSRLDQQNLSKILLKCFSFKSNPEITWFIDQKDPLKGQSGEPLYVNLSESQHTISCVDDASLSSEATIRLKKE